MARHLAIVPARAGSSGIPGKNLLPLGGEPLVARAIEQAKATGLFDSIVVSSDSNEILRVAKERGVTALLRPMALSGGDVLITEVVSHVLSVLKNSGVEDFSTVTVLNPTSPFRTPKDIVATHKLMKEQDAKCGLTVTGITPIIMCRRKRGVRRYWHQASLETMNRQRRTPMWVQNGAVYIVDVPYFLETGKLVGEKCSVHPMPKDRSLDLDDPIDYYAAVAWAEELKKIEGTGGREEKAAASAVLGAVLPPV